MDIKNYSIILKSHDDACRATDLLISMGYKTHSANGIEASKKWFKVWQFYTWDLDEFIMSNVKYTKSLLTVDDLELYKRKKLKKIYKPEEDPWGEEDWEYVKEQFDDIKKSLRNYKIVLNGLDDALRVTELLNSIGIKTYSATPEEVIKSWGIGRYEFYGYTGNKFQMAGGGCGELAKKPQLTVKDLEDMFGDVKRYKKIYKSEEDPWGEENWGYVKENIKLDDIKNDLSLLKKCDIIVNNESDYILIGDLLKSIGFKIISNNIASYRLDKWKFIYFDDYLQSFAPSYIRYNDLSLTSKELCEICEKKLKKKLDPENDPWNEEDWGYVKEHFDIEKDYEDKDKFEVGDIVVSKHHPELGTGLVHTIEGQVAYIKFDTLYNDYIDIRSNNYKFLKKEKKIGSTKNYICGYVVNNKDEFYRLMIYLNKKGYSCIIGKTTSLAYDEDYQVVLLNNDVNKIIYFTTMKIFLENKDKLSPNFIMKKLPFKITKIGEDEDPWSEETPTYEEIDESVKEKTYEMSGPPPKHLWANKKAFEEDMEKLGFIHTTLTKQTSMLICSEEGTLKYEKAERYNIPIFTYEEAYKIFSKIIKKKKYNFEDDPWSEEDWGYVKEDGEENCGWKKTDESSGNLKYLDNYAIKLKNEEEYDRVINFFSDTMYRWPGTAYLKKPGYTNDKYILIHSDEKNLSSIFSDEMFHDKKNKKIISCDDFFSLINKKIKMKTDLENDPWGEENWGFVQENNISDSDLVNYVVKIKNEHEYLLLIDFFDNLGYTWPGGPRLKGVKYTDDFLFFIIPDRKIINSPRKYNFDSTRLRNKKIVSCDEFLYEYKNVKKIYKPEEDPWGEENWGYVRENSNIPIEILKKFDIEIKNLNDAIEVTELLQNSGYNTYRKTKKDVIETYMTNKWKFYHYDSEHFTMGNIGRNEIITVDELKKFLNKKYIKKTDESDPWGEENWGYLEGGEDD